jgi:hypothetical protein
MRRNRVLRIVAMVALGILAFTVFGFVVMQLWNWLMPALFELRTITFWQAIGLLLLSRLLFGRFGGFHRHRSEWRHRMREKFEHMTPEEREAMRRKMGGWCGVTRSEAAEPKA